MRILITGADGRLGSRLVTRLQSDHEVIPTDIATLDITDADQVYRRFVDEQPDLVIHAAAMTAVDDCARQPDLALRINGLGTKHVALACAAVDTPVCYISTNEVFDGRNTGYYREYDPPNPINAYGYSKWVGEQVIRDHLTRFYIVRTSWLFAHGGKNFIHTMLGLAAKGVPFNVVVNEVGAPTYNDDLADALVKLIHTQQYGIYHFVNEGRASRWQFARTILDMSGYSDLTIHKIAAAEFRRASTPPEYSVLHNTVGAALGITLRTWQDALRSFLEQEGHLADDQ